MRLVSKERDKAVRAAIKSDDPKKLGELLERAHRNGERQDRSGSTETKIFITIRMEHQGLTTNKTMEYPDGGIFIGSGIINNSPIVKIRCDIPLNSRTHARIEIINGRILLTDFGSEHGTYWNGRRINQNQQVDITSNPEFIMSGTPPAFQQGVKVNLSFETKTVQKNGTERTAEEQTKLDKRLEELVSEYDDVLQWAITEANKKRQDEELERLKTMIKEIVRDGANTANLSEWLGRTYQTIVR